MRRRYWIALGVAAVAVIAAGSAVAATKFTAPNAGSKAIIGDAAGRLHVTAGALSGALEKALDDQVDADVAAGRLTKQQGDALKARIDKGQVPLVGGIGAFGSGRLGHGFGRFGPGFGDKGFGFRHAGGMLGAGLDTVTSYLGITQEQLRTALAGGKSLAAIAKAHGKTAGGLVAALVAAAKTKLDHAVAAKHLSSAQEQSMLGKLQTFFKSFVNGTLPSGHDLMHHGFGGGFGPGLHHQFGKPPGSKQPPATTKPPGQPSALGPQL
jgi:hypothetical protein